MPILQYIGLLRRRSDRVRKTFLAENSAIQISKNVPVYFKGFHIPTYLIVYITCSSGILFKERISSYCTFVEFKEERNCNLIQ
jgi:hypothetical protein